MPNPIFPAILQGDVATVQALAANPANRDARTDLHDDHGSFYQSMTPLMVASAAPGELAEIVQILLDAGADPNEASAGEVGPAFYAAGGGGFWPPEPELAPEGLAGDYAERLRLLLAAGANPNQTADNGRNLVTEAAQEGDPKRVRTLLAAGASPHAPEEVADHSERIRAMFPDWDEDSEELLRRKNPDGKPSYTIPLFGAAEGGSSECVRLLLEAGAPLQERDENDRTALYYAATANVARMLIQQGLDANDRDTWMEALDSERDDVAEALLQNGLDPNRMEDSWSLLHHTAFRLHPKGVRLLARYGADLSTRTTNKESPLHGAAWQGDGNMGTPTERNEETVRALVEIGFDVNERDAYGQTPLHQAAGGDWCSPTSIRVLLELGALPDPISTNGRTPLMDASRWGDSEGVRLLTEAGARPDRTNEEGETVREMALRNRDFHANALAEAIETEDDEDIEWSTKQLEKAERSLELLG